MQRDHRRGRLELGLGCLQPRRLVVGPQRLRRGTLRGLELALQLRDRAIALIERSLAAMLRAFDEVEKAFGTVTILVNNAGVAHANRAVDLPAEEWRRVVGTNLDAVFFWAQEAARRMLAAKQGGAIVNVSSINALTGPGEMATYSAAKGAINTLTKSLARAWGADGIRVNALSPGWVVTPLANDKVNQCRRRSAANALATFRKTAAFV